MKAARVLFAVVAFATAPFVALAAQGNSETCNADQARTVAEMRRTGKQVPPGLAKKCPPPAPVPPAPPPPGIHGASGVVYDDQDGNGVRDQFAGEMGLAGWTVSLYDANDQFMRSTTSDANGNFEFPQLGSGTYSVCVSQQSGFSMTQPIGGSGCGGAGYRFALAGMIETWVMNNYFGMLVQ